MLALSPDQRAAWLAAMVDAEGHTADGFTRIAQNDGPVADAVWKLFEIVIGQCGPLPTLVEWDSNIPDWPILKAEAAAARAILDRGETAARAGDRHAAA